MTDVGSLFNFCLKRTLVNELLTTMIDDVTM